MTPKGGRRWRARHKDVGDDALIAIGFEKELPAVNEWIAGITENIGLWLSPLDRLVLRDCQRTLPRTRLIVLKWSWSILAPKPPRGGVMRRAVASRPSHPYHHIQTLQACWPRVWIDRAFHTFTLRLPGFSVSRAGRLPELVIRSM